MSDVELNRTRLKLINLTIQNPKTCSSCKKTYNNTYFTSLDGTSFPRDGYNTCSLCRIKNKNKRCTTKLKPMISEGFYIKAEEDSP